MPPPSYETEPTPLDPSSFDLRNDYHALCVELVNGHTYYLRDTDIEDIKTAIKDRSVAIFNRHFQNEGIARSSVGINCAHIVTFYPVRTPEDVSNSAFAA